MTKEKKITIKLHTYKGTTKNLSNGLSANPLYIRVTYNRKSTRFPFLHGNENVYVSNNNESVSYHLISNNLAKNVVIDKSFEVKKKIIERLIKEEVYGKNDSFFTFGKLSEKLFFYEESVTEIVITAAYNEFLEIAKKTLTYDKYEKLSLAFKKYFIDKTPVHTTLGIKNIECYNSTLPYLTWLINEVRQSTKNMDFQAVVAANTGIKFLHYLNLFQAAFAFNQLLLSVKKEVFVPSIDNFSFNENRYNWYLTESYKSDMDIFIEKWGAKQASWTGRESKLYLDVFKYVLPNCEFDLQSIESIVDTYVTSNFLG